MEKLGSNRNHNKVNPVETTTKEKVHCITPLLGVYSKTPGIPCINNSLQDKYGIVNGLKCKLPMRIFTIYRATNTVNGKVYIGHDSKWPSRMQGHLYASVTESERSYNFHFHRAIRKHGWDAFVWEPIYQSKDGEHCLTVMEPYFIELHDSYNTGYNRTLGGQGALGRVVSDETRKKVSNKLKGQKRTPEQCKKYSEAFKGRIISPEHRAKQSAALKGRPKSPEHIRAVALAITGKKRPQWDIDNRAAKMAKKYTVTCPDGTVLYISNMAKFCREHGLSDSNMLKVAFGKNRTSKGYTCKKGWD